MNGLRLLFDGPFELVASACEDVLPLRLVQAVGIHAVDVDAYGSIRIAQGGFLNKAGEVLLDALHIRIFLLHGVVGETAYFQQEVLQAVVERGAGGEYQFTHRDVYVSLFGHYGKDDGVGVGRR